MRAVGHGSHETQTRRGDKMEKTLTKVRDLTPSSKQVNVHAKVMNVGEAKEVMGKYR